VKPADTDRGATAYKWSGVGLAHRINGGHWLTFDGERHITGCHCGFKADPDDAGYGDSVLDHFEQVVRAEERARRDS